MTPVSGKFLIRTSVWLQDILSRVFYDVPQSLQTTPEQFVLISYYSSSLALADGFSCVGFMYSILELVFLFKWNNGTSVADISSANYRRSIKQ
jgi:hypothetical protein